MKILQVNSSDTRGGAARVATSLHEAYRSHGHDSWLVVGHKLGNDAHTLALRHDWAGSWWSRPFWWAESLIARRRFRGARVLRQIFRFGAQPRHFIDWYKGYEEFNYPGTRNLLSVPGEAVDILHLHNLHGHYFDLRQLPHLTAKLPTLIHLHDAWLLSGHCAFSFDCQRWRIGCGQCPDLQIEPAIRRDATAENWRRKQRIYVQSRYHVVTPSQWLANKIHDSPLAAGLLSTRVIPNGINLNLFQPGHKSAARKQLDLAQDKSIILMVANGFRNNPWKDFQTARRAFKHLAGYNLGEDINVLAIGDDMQDEHYGRVHVRFIPYVADEAVLARYYQAADLFLSTSRVEVFGMVISEALACGTPVVATAVGGVSEQVSSWYRQDSDRPNGLLNDAADAEGLAHSISLLLKDSQLQQELGHNASNRAAAELNIDRQVKHQLAYYREIMSQSNLQDAR